MWLMLNIITAVCAIVIDWQMSVRTHRSRFERSTNEPKRRCSTRRRSRVLPSKSSQRRSSRSDSRRKLRQLHLIRSWDSRRGSEISAGFLQVDESQPSRQHQCERGHEQGEPTTVPNSCTTASSGMYNLIAGCIAAAVAAAVTFPLDVVKIKLQSGGETGFVGVVTYIIAEQGIRGFYRGLTPTMLGTVPIRAFFLWAMAAASAVLVPLLGEGPTTNMISSAAAGMLRNVVANPLGVTKTRMQMTGAGFVQTAQAILLSHGIAGFYRGFLLSFVGIVEGAIQSLIYEQLKRRWARSPASSTSPHSSLTLLSAAALSKAFACIWFYPHEVVLTRMSSDAAEYATVLSTVEHVLSNEGVQALYAGLGANLLRSVPNTAIMFVLFELLQRKLPLLMQQRPWERVLHACWPAGVTLHKAI